MKQMLIAGTRQWNPGDEFIQRGVQNLLEEYFDEEISWPLLDRASVLTELYFENGQLKECLKNKQRMDWMPSNCWAPKYGLDGLDYVVIGGSPDWSGRRLWHLYQAAAEKDIKVLVLGAGCRRRELAKTPVQKKLFEKAEFISTRDTAARDEISSVLNKKNIHLFPCPALFAAKEEREVKELKKIALTVQDDKALWHSASNFKEMIALYHELSKDYDVEIVCHYIDEYHSAIKITDKVSYSYDARDYEDIYKKYDIVISTRLHGAVFANSVGTPSIFISQHKESQLNNTVERAAALEPFPHIPMMTCDQIVESLRSLDVRELSKKIIAFKRNSKKKYLEAMSSINK